MQAMRLWSRYFNFFHLHQFARCSSILNSNISVKYWKIVNFQNQQLSFPFCTFLKDYTQQNETTAEKQATEQPYLANFGTGRRAGNKYIEVLRSVKLDYLLSSGKEKVLLIQMSRSKNGHKWIQLAKRDKLAIHYNQFPKIAVPKDAYLLLKAMDALLSKYMDDEKPPISYKLVKGGRFYDYKLGISQYENFEFYMETITTEANPLHRSENMHIPIRLLPLLRNLMAEMLEEFDGSQQIRSRRIPKWIPENDPIDGIIVKNDNKEEKSIGIKQLNFMVDIEPQQRMIMIELKRSDNGMKFIGISMKSLNDQIKFKHDKIFTNFVNIPVPEDAYPLLNAMCVLDNHCQNQLLYNAIQQNQGTLICHQMVKGIFFDYQLKIHVRRNQQLAFKMETITTDTMPSHKPKYLEGPIPIEVFRWLKNQIAEMLLSDYLQEQQNKL